MMSKVYFALFVTLAVAQLALADPLLCPDPENAKELAYKEEVHVEAPTFGRIEKVVTVPAPERPFSCVTLIGYASSGISSAVSEAAIGVSEEGLTIRLISKFKTGIDVEVKVYTE